MPGTQRLSEQTDSTQGYREEEIRVKKQSARGGRIEGAEGGLRADIFDHDENSEYDFSEHDCMICEIPEHAQNLVVEDMEAEDNA